MGATCMCGAGMKVANLDFHHLVWEKHCSSNSAHKQVKYLKVQTKNRVLCVTPPTSALVYCGYWTGTLCEHASTTPTEEQQEGAKHEEVFISIQAFPALLDVSPSCEIKTVSCGSRHTAAVTGKKHWCMARDDEHWHHYHWFIFFIISVKGDLYTWGWGKFGGDMLFYLILFPSIVTACIYATWTPLAFQSRNKPELQQLDIDTQTQ